jgi:hypothetical protein
MVFDYNFGKNIYIPMKFYLNPHYHLKIIYFSINGFKEAYNYYYYLYQFI